jgi:catechol 2,3-dioxygenase-like lactoylglutathione lyase family enzyme
MSVDFTGITPLIQVFDMNQSVRFYCDLLGFEIVSRSPEVDTPEGRFSHWMWLRRGGANLMLNTAYDSGERPDFREAGRWRGHRDTGLFIDCSDVDALYDEIREHVPQLPPPSVTPYGMRSLRLHDPDGYEVNFQTRV